MTRVLVVDDDPQIRTALEINLRVRGYEVHSAGTGEEALRGAGRKPPDLVVLDLGLPDLDGTDVIRGLRGWCTAPIIVLSGRAEGADKVDALDAGADDYVTKPFGIEELLARLRAVARRTGVAEAEPRVQLGGFVVDLAARTVQRTPEAAEDNAVDGDEQVRLTPTEWHVLEILLRNPGRLITQRQLLTDVWGPAYVSETNYLRVYLTQLRRKLEVDSSRPKHLITEPGMGYRFQP